MYLMPWVTVRQRCKWILRGGRGGIWFLTSVIPLRSIQPGNALSPWDHSAESWDAHSHMDVTCFFGMQKPAPRDRTFLTHVGICFKIPIGLLNAIGWIGVSVLGFRDLDFNFWRNVQHLSLFPTFLVSSWSSSEVFLGLFGRFLGVIWSFLGFWEFWWFFLCCLHCCAFLVVDLGV